MKVINFANVEKLIFEDRAVHDMLPSSYFSYFEQWKLAKQFPMLRSIGKQATFDLLNSLTDRELKILEEYFKEPVVVEPIDYSIVREVKVPVGNSDEVCEALCRIRDHFYFTTWRDESHLYICLWR